MADKNNWIAFVEDINKALNLEPPYPVEDEEETLADIANRQDGDDAFVDEDYLPENKIGLKDSTVAWLIGNDIKVPETWNKRLKKQKAKVDKPAKTADKADKKVASEKTEKSTKAEKKGKATAGKGKVAMALEAMKKYIEKGIAKKDLLEKLVAEFPETSKSTFQVQLYKAMKKETCQFEKLVVKDAKGLLRFE